MTHAHISNAQRLLMQNIYSSLMGRVKCVTLGSHNAEQETSDQTHSEGWRQTEAFC